MRNVTISAAVSLDDYQNIVAAVAKTRITLSSFIALALRRMLQLEPEEIERLCGAAHADGALKKAACNE